MTHVFVDDGDGDCRYCPLPEANPVHATPGEKPLPDLPYAGTSGWSGSETSRERAEDEDESGVTSARQAAALNALEVRGDAGLTWRELAEVYGWHHGQASGALSVLHKEGRIARLAKVRRNRCSVYVLPAHVEGREVAPHGGRTLSTLEREALARVEAAVEAGHPVSPTAARLVADALRRFARLGPP